ncbi:dihydropteroate synthase [Candidatus Regiella insecticola 5.15]|uniref:Dihydropteroate synthase n=1 Tax=Candidatus Regiella insecticola 5.15 TaxID=1005043 RepID=G2GXY2_9ENTR|nr:dihydropteroate synthase [Candidatus Regiella insecticola]EGY29408.1 dihydropteroate synthase [Candidatus Regiella insecticola 5.15]
MKLTTKNRVLDLSQPQIMGILNVTPDSFSDGGQYRSLDNALQHAKMMITEGATLIDIGGESTRPGATPVSVKEELDRVIPVIKCLATEALVIKRKIWLSVDTSKAAVITEAAKNGAHLINDVRALQEPGALEAAAATGLPVCLMHMQGTPDNMQVAPNYENLFDQINQFFQQRIKSCTTAGIAQEKLILDPGFGFGKSLEHNYQLLAQLEKFHHFNLPLLVGISRKSMVGQSVQAPPAQRVTGSIACAVIAAMQRAKIIRVHDVKETVEAMHIVKATLISKEQN